MQIIGRMWQLALDRTAVLFIGMAVGGAIACAYFADPAQPKLAAVSPAKLALAANAVGFTPDHPGPWLIEAVGEGRPIGIGVFGDSFGDGIWSGVYRHLARDGQFQVYQFSKPGTGFTRYRSLNLLDDMRAKLDRQPIDIAILSFGANDTQGIFEHGHGAAYMSDDWRRIVGARVEAMVQLLRARGVTLYWVGLPKMREAGFDGEIMAMNGFYADEMRKLDVPFVDTTTLTVDRAGHYAAYLPNPVTGELTSARANDGVHMTMNGYAFLTRGLSERIRGSVAAVGAQLGNRRFGRVAEAALPVANPRA